MRYTGKIHSLSQSYKSLPLVSLDFTVLVACTKFRKGLMIDRRFPTLNGQGNH